MSTFDFEARDVCGFANLDFELFWYPRIKIYTTHIKKNGAKFKAELKNNIFFVISTFKSTS